MIFTDDFLAASHRSPEHLKKRFHLEAGQKAASVLLQRIFAPPKRALAQYVENQIIGLAASCEILFGIINDLVGSKGFHQPQPWGTIYAGNFRPVMLGQLDGD